MSTTLKLPDELKRRVATVARSSGTTAHAFMVEAIRAETDRAEARRAMFEAAQAARSEFEEQKSGYDMAEVHSYVLAKAAGKPARRPRKKQWRR